MEWEETLTGPQYQSQERKRKGKKSRSVLDLVPKEGMGEIVSLSASGG